MKWAPGTATALDLTVNPDFSQVEADVSQIAVNNRFALFYPEKRPFFLESTDLFETPIEAVYTRTITSPRWGGRATGRLSGLAYTVLAADDRGGGSVVLPGPTGSSLAPQDYRRSWASRGRGRIWAPRSWARSMRAARSTEEDTTASTGPTSSGAPAQVDVVDGQFLWSETETPNLPDIVPEWDGRRLDGHALQASWGHTPERWDTFLSYRDVAYGFRDDQGFVPQVGYRRGYAEAGLAFYPRDGFLTRLRPYAFGEYQSDRGNQLIDRRYGGAFAFVGRRSLNGFLRRHRGARAHGRRAPRPHLRALLAGLEPARAGCRGWPSRARWAQDIDLVSVRVGTGANLTAQPAAAAHEPIYPGPPLLVVLAGRGRRPGGEARLFTAQVERAKLVYNFSARLYLRLIGEYVARAARRHPVLRARGRPIRLLLRVRPARLPPQLADRLLRRLRGRPGRASLGPAPAFGAAVLREAVVRLPAVNWADAPLPGAGTRTPPPHCPPSPGGRRDLDALRSPRG